MLMPRAAKKQSMIKLLIIADDLTGALDTGVQFAKHGTRTLVTADACSGAGAGTCASLGSALDAASIGIADIETLCIDTESRHMPAQEAYARVRALAEEAVTAGVPRIYKKTDSALRGNIGAELAALGDATGAPVMFVPAYPKNGRTTRNGVQYVGGVPVAETSFARDPIDPVAASGVAEIIAMQSGIKTVCVPIVQLSKLDIGANCAATIGGACAGGEACAGGGICESGGACAGGGAYASSEVCAGGVYIFDSETDSDLDAVGRALQSAGRLAVLAGCAGFAEKLPGLLQLANKEQGTQKSSAQLKSGSVLLVSGSVSDVAAAQLDRASLRGYRSFSLSPAQKLAAGSVGKAERTQVAAEIIAELSSGCFGGGRFYKPSAASADATASFCGGMHGSGGNYSRGGRVILRAAASRADVAETDGYAKRIGTDAKDIPRLIAESLAAITKIVIESGKAGNLVVFGGDTLLAVMRALSGIGIVPRAEIAPGVAASDMLLPGGRSLGIITKAGGFGGADVVEIIDGCLCP